MLFPSATKRIIDCWWESLPIMLWTWKQVAWRSPTWFLQVNQNLHVARITYFPLCTSAHSHPLKKKEKREEGKEDVNAQQTGGEKRQLCAIFFFFFVLAGNQALLDYVIKCIEIQVSPLSPSSILFSTVMWVQRTAAVGKKRAEGQSHFRPERTWCFEGKS